MHSKESRPLMKESSDEATGDSDDDAAPIVHRIPKRRKRRRRARSAHTAPKRSNSNKEEADEAVDIERKKRTLVK